MVDGCGDDGVDISEGVIASVQKIAVADYDEFSLVGRQVDISVYFQVFLEVVGQFNEGEVVVVLLADDAFEFLIGLFLPISFLGLVAGKR